jgi:hypothetical protein
MAWGIPRLSHPPIGQRGYDLVAFSIWSALASGKVLFPRPADNLLRRAYPPWRYGPVADPVPLIMEKQSEYICNISALYQLAFGVLIYLS